MTAYNAILIVSFGGPEKPDDVMPFLENVLRGRNVPRERMLEVAGHYLHFGGKSPINDQNRALITALQAELARSGPALPVYWGNRNWHPFLAETLDQMRRDGAHRALAFVTSAYSSYSGCRQYREDIERARLRIGDGAPQIDKLRVFYNHPGFVGPMAESVAAALDKLPGAEILFTAHSIPLSMAQTSCYEVQVREAARLVLVALGRDTPPTLVFQSRSGVPGQPWLEPDVGDYLRQHKPEKVVIVPIGFISDHMEVLYDLDTEARELSGELGIQMVRAATVGTQPRFISMIRELIVERLEPGTERLALGPRGPNHDVCPLDCCPAPQRSPTRSGISAST